MLACWSLQPLVWVGTLILINSYSNALSSPAPPPSQNILVNATLWRAPQARASTAALESAWPELDPALGLLNRTSPSAICFSGGGSRAYTAALGQLRALHDLGLLKKIRYITGVSGGGWAASSYLFFQNLPPTDMGKQQFLGEILAPENITLKRLALLLPGCGRGATNTDMIFTLLKAITSKRISDHAAWQYMISETFLAPAGIGHEDVITWSNYTKKDILERNPNLTSMKFLVQRSDDPFLILGITNMGPLSNKSEGQIFYAHRPWTVLEATPLYVGIDRRGNLSYHRHGMKHPIVQSLGGFVETFGFGGEAPSAGLARGENKSWAHLSVLPKGSAPLSFYAGATSFYPGDAFATVFGLKGFESAFAVETNYWSPSDLKPQTSVNTLADGGTSQNPNIISVIRRGVKEIVLFGNFEVPLALRPAFDPAKDPEKAGEDKVIDDGIPAFFGFGNSSHFGYENSRNQIFNRQDLIPFLEDLQDSLATGRGAVARRELETINNSWWGVEAGFQLNLTIVYLSRAFEWEARLPAEMKSLFPTKNDTQILVKSGTFKGFPNYNTEQLDLNPSQSNLLADFSGWVVKRNAEIMFEALGR